MANADLDLCIDVAAAGSAAAFERALVRIDADGALGRLQQSWQAEMDAHIRMLLSDAAVEAALARVGDWSRPSRGYRRHVRRMKAARHGR